MVLSCRLGLNHDIAETKSLLAEVCLASSGDMQDQPAQALLAYPVLVLRTRLFRELVCYLGVCKGWTELGHLSAS